MPRAQRLDELVSAHCPGARLEFFEPLKGGVSADVTRLDLVLPDGAKRSVVLREHGPRHDGHPLAVEYATLATVHEAGLAVPKPLACDDSGALLDQPWILMEFIAGSTDIPEHEADNRIETMATHLLTVHATPLADLPNLPLVLDPIPELLGWLSGEARWTGLRATLQERKSARYTGERVLVHGDFWPHNIIWDEDGAIKAVLDWEDACIGDPNADVAFSCLELRYVFGQEGERRFKRAYSQSRAINPLRFALWQAYAGVHAYHHMAYWGLEPNREELMRRTAVATIDEAAAVIVS